MESVRSGTQAQLAAERGVDDSRVSRYKKLGLLAFLPDGRVDLDESHRRIDQKLNRRKGKRRNGNVTSTGPVIPPVVAITSPAAAPTSPPAVEAGAKGPTPGTEKSADEVRYWAAKVAREEEERKQAALKTRKDEAETQLAEMKAAQLAGTLVSAAGVEKTLREDARAERNALSAIPDRTAPVLASMTSPSEIHKYLTAEIEKALRGLRIQLEERAAEAARAEESEMAVS